MEKAKNAINALSSVYMLVYPFAIQFTFTYFEDRPMGLPGNGLRRGILIGAFLNTLGAGVRWLGAAPSIYGFIVLFVGQTVAAVAQVFMLAIPPQLAVAWFPKNEINIATSIAVSANNLGVAAGCAFTPLMVRQASHSRDIPFLLFLQFVMCLVVFFFVRYAFQKPPPYWRSAMQTIISVDQQALRLLKEKRFIYMLISYSIIMGSQCTIITLLAQILIPPFRTVMDEQYIGLLGALMLFLGVPASILGGYYLDKTAQYSEVCTLLSAVAAASTLGLYFSCEIGSVIGVVLSCICFGVASYAISPAFFQFASELFYPVSEIIPTGYLFTVGNIGGVFLVAVMGWCENLDSIFPMRWPLLCLAIAMWISVYFMSQVKGVLKRTESLAL
ncbi:major facilitator superfamily domain-containing protein [Blakeslea trispora]|nr:major facilitator superfamily domain-containing protein [Blakeslea trispora]